MQKLLAEIVKVISATQTVEKIYLFGSRARGDADERSDIDIAVEAPQISERQWLDIVDRTDDINTLYSIDLSNLLNVSDEFKNEIKTQGKLLYEQTKNTKIAQ